jgi:hypothetical protein
LRHFETPPETEQQPDAAAPASVVAIMIVESFDGERRRGVGDNRKQLPDKADLHEINGATAHAR